MYRETSATIRILLLLGFGLLHWAPAAVLANPAVRALQITSGDMVHDASRDLVWLSGRADSAAFSNRVVGLNPETMTVERSFAVGPDPELLELSGDSRYLYVSLRGAPGYQRIDLAEGQVSPRYTFETGLSGPYYVIDMAVVPGQPLVLAATISSGSGSSQQLGIYENGVPRPDVVPYSQNVTAIGFAGDSSVLFGHNGQSSGFDFRRFAVDQNGVRHLDSTMGVFQGFNRTFRSFGDWLISEDGVVFDPHHLRMIARLPAGSWPQDTILDRDLGKIFHLERAGNRNMRVEAFDATTFTRAGSLTITGLGDPLDMVRWGDRGLAIRMADRVIAVEDDLVQADGPEADLRTEVVVEPVQRIAGETFSYRIRVSNAGPDAAGLARLSHQVPNDLEILSVTAPGGNAVLDGRTLTVDWPVLEMNDIREVVLEAKTATRGRFHIRAEASSEIADPQPVSAAGEGWLHVNPVVRDHTVLAERSLLVKDLVAAPGSGLIYASVDRDDPLYPNRVVEIDPVTGEIVRVFFVGADPGKMAVSPEGILYVTTQDGFNVNRIVLATGENDLNFGLGVSTHGHTRQLRYVDDLAVFPGAPNSLAVATRVANARDALAVFDSGIIRAETSAFGQFVTSIAVNDAGNRIYGFNGGNSAWEFREFAVSSSGVTHVASTQNLLTGWRNDLSYSDGLIYSTAGTVIDPGPPEIAGVFAGEADQRVSLAVLPERNRILFLESDGSISAFALNTFNQTASWQIPDVPDAKSPLLVLDGNRMAFARNQSLVLVESTVPDLNPVSLNVEIGNEPLDMRVGMNWTYVVRITNTGTAPAADLRISQQSVVSLSRIGVETTKGTVSLSSNSFAVHVEEIMPGETVEVAVTVRPNAVRSYRPILEVSTLETDTDPGSRIRELPFAARAAGALRVEVADEAWEGDGILAGEGTVSLGKAEAFDVVVTLESSMDSKVRPPASVTIPAGSVSATFDLEILDNELLDGPQTVTVTARAAGFSSGAASIRVHDDESAVITLTLPESVRRGESALGKIAIDAIPSRALRVDLRASEIGLLALPPSVVIPAGAQRAEFTFQASTEMPPIEGAPVTVTAFFPGWTGDAATLLVLPPPPNRPFNPSPKTSGDFVSSSPTLTWNHPGSIELVVNGSFSSGDFRGWQQENSGDGGWAINDGTFDPPGPEGPQPPFSGGHAAISYQTEGGSRMLFQDILLPYGAEEITLRWRNRIQNAAGQYVPGEQAYRVEIYEEGGAFREMLFETFDWFPIQTQWQLREADLTRFQGERIRLAFIQADELGSLNVSLDDVSMIARFPGIERVEGDLFDIYLGTSPYLDKDDLIGTVATPRLPLAELERGTTYYWQIVARRGNEAVATPVWTFRTAALEVEIFAPEGPTAEKAIEFDVVFTEAVLPPALESFITSNSVATSISGEGNHYVVTVEPQEYGRVGLLLPENVVQTLDGEGNAAAAASMFYIGSATFERWREFYFSTLERYLDPEGTGRKGDARNEGVPNLIRYAVGMTGRKVDRSLLPRPIHLDTGGDAAFGMVFHWHPDSLDVDYVIEASEDLRNWRDAADSIEIVSIEDAGATARITVRDKDSAGEHRKRFLRLRVIETDEPANP